MATLVHDDVLDAAPLRRGHATVWARHGEALARATGDHLFALAFAGLAQAGSPEAVALLAQASLDLARGEALQSEQARRPEITVEAYLERCRFKTGRLFAAACALGGMFGGLDRAGIEALERFGEQLGIAFQLADDLLDCDGDPESTGKALGVDLLDGTVTLPLLLAAQRDESVAAALVDRDRAAGRRARDPRARGRAPARSPTRGARCSSTPRRPARPWPRCPSAAIAAHSRLSCRQRPPATTESRWQARLRAR